tara:strand:+ start:191 stop:706 length:516 start_codon:yes stop_codon:yes gene_type:complete
MISRSTMSKQMKGNKMPIEIKKRKTGKYSPPKPSAKKRTPKKSPKGGMPFLAPGQKERMDQLTGRGKPLEAKGGGVMRKNIGKMLETFSPSYSVMKGKGLTAEMLGMAKPKPMAAPLTKEQREAQAQQQIMANKKGTSNRMTPMTGMMAGGPVKRKRSIDGCAMKGKTRAM